MAATNHDLVEALRGLLYDKGPAENGAASVRAARFVAEYDTSTSADRAVARVFDRMMKDLESSTLAALSREELATVLAALRHYQSCGYGDPMEREEDIHEIATSGGDLTSLDDAGIDELCERLNGGNDGDDGSYQPVYLGAKE